MEQQKEKIGRGRPVGTKNYVAIGTEELSKLFQGAEIPVPKKWLKQVGVNPNQFRDFDAKAGEAIHQIEVAAHVVNKPKEEPKAKAKLKAKAPVKKAPAKKAPAKKAPAKKGKVQKVKMAEGEEIEFLIEA